MVENPPPETLITVARHPGDWRYARYRLDAVRGIHWSAISGGYGAKSQTVLYGYVFCDGMVDGEVAHSGIHGECPHEILVFIPQAHNDRRVVKHLRELAGPRSIS